MFLFTNKTIGPLHFWILYYPSECVRYKDVEFSSESFVIFITFYIKCIKGQKVKHRLLLFEMTYEVVTAQLNLNFS